MNRRFFVLFLLFPLFSFAQQFDVSTNKGTVEFTYADGTKGTFSGVNATINFDISKLSAGSVSGSVDVSTIDTDNKLRNKHLKGKDYFNVENYPTMTFESSSMWESGGDLMVKGVLKIKETEKEVTFNAKEQDGSLVFTTTIYGLDFDVAPNKKREKTKIDVSVKIPM